MSAGKKRTPGNTFHIQYPARKDFFTWVEVGCLTRALGFPPDLIRHNLNEEIEYDDEGISVQQILRMMDLKLLHQSLHRSFNMHTADWNLCVIKKAMKFLQINVLSFEEVHSIRVAYATYEAGDMKGLNLDRRTLLRTLKMCQRVISPKKLMHRVKHMRSKLEEANRIQLYEFFELILWCDFLENQSQAELIKEADGKDNNLYNLVDFETLLSHQDQRQSRALDERYLAEEWDFGHERFGSKQMFKGEVVYTDQREHQTQTQKRKYRHLKRVVGQSQRSVYRAMAGSIRARPISAPNLSMYASPRGSPRERSTSAAAVYKSVQRRLHSAPTRASQLDVSDRPVIPEYVRVHTPSVVTANDLTDVTIKMENLEFDITTLESRCQVKLEDERNFYIPDYVPSTKEDSSDGVVQEPKAKEEHWTPEIIHNLAYPPLHKPLHHGVACDARFRGWKPSTRRGHQKILTVPTFDTSPHGLLLAKQRAVMLAPVRAMHRDYVVRYTSKGQATQQRRAQRPCTAPASSPRTSLTRTRPGCRSAGTPRRSVDGNAQRDTEEEEGEGDKGDDDKEKGPDVSKTKDGSTEQGESSSRAPSFPDPTGKYAKDGVKGGLSTSTSDTTRSAQKDSTSSWRSYQGESSSSKTSGRKGEDEELSGSSTLASSGAGSPSKRPNRSKTVEVGLMGTIQLLESIKEQEAEERLSEASSFSSSSSESLTEHERRLLATSSANSRVRIQEETLPDTHKEQRKQMKDVDGGEKAKVDLAAFQEDSSRKGDRKLSGEKGANVGWADDKGADPGNKLFPASQTEQTADDLKTTAAAKQTSFPLFTAMQGQGSSGSSARLIVEKPGEKAGVEQKRAESVASSSITDGSDDREVHTPLTSITVTIKNKDQPGVTSSTRRNDDVDLNPTTTTANNNNTNSSNSNNGSGAQSPNGFRSSRPCVTSTPRQWKPSYNIARTSIDSTASRPASGSRDRSVIKAAPVLPTTDRDYQIGWLQDQILAMNYAYEQYQVEHPTDFDTERPENNPENVDNTSGENTTTSGGPKKSIQFSSDVQDPDEARPKLKHQSSTERLLRSNKFDLDTEAPRRYVFNKATTRRLLERVNDVISPELRSRIRKGDTGLKVI